MAKTILIVDDEPQILSILEDVLTGEGHRVLKATNGKEATKLLSRSEIKCDSIISDYFMPQMNGHELMKWIQENQIKIETKIIISGNHDEILTKKFSNLDVTHFLNKPFDLDELMDIIEGNLLDRCGSF